MARSDWTFGIVARLRIVAAVAALPFAIGCYVGQHPQPPAEEVAMLEPDASVLIEAVDGVGAGRAYVSAPMRVTAGQHTVRVRRRVELPTSLNRAAAPHSIRLGTDGLGTSAYVSDSFCPLTFTAVAGQRYRLTTTAPNGEAAPWLASVQGPDVDATCSGRERVPIQLVGRTMYLCCNMTFRDGYTKDSNYDLTGPGSSRLPAGTRVVVTEVQRDRIAFRVDPEGDVYTVYLEYGIFNTDAETYFGDLLRETDPTGGVRPPNDLAVGMTREEAIAVRGYPPQHRTPDRNAPVWLYYNRPGQGTYVTFRNGMIAEIRDGDAP